MKTMHRILSLALSACLGVSMAACSSEGNSSSAAAPQSSASTQTSNSAPAAAPVSNYPKAPIELIVPAGPGGGTDIAARIAAKHLQKKLGQSVVVVNMNGAGGTLGAQDVLSANPDGYKVLFFHNSILINDLMKMCDFNHTNFKMGPNLFKDNTNGFIVDANSEYNTLETWIKAAQEQPEEAIYATETGAFTHLQILATQKAINGKFNVVDVGSASDRTAALLSGSIDSMCNVYCAVKGNVDAGQFKYIGFPSPERNPYFPDVPTVKELGYDLDYPGYFFSFFFPPETPDDVVDTFTKAVAEIAADPSLEADLEPYRMEVDYRNPADNRTFMDSLKKLYAELANSL